jgi:Uma2 family endonuclease
MGMPAQKTEWTADMARALPDDGNRYEVLDGELLVSPAPTWRHQKVLMKLYKLIDRYVEAHSLGWTMVSPADIEFSPRHWVQPDLFVVPDEGTGEPQSWKDVKQLLLVAEVLSPSTANTDRSNKRPTYQKYGVPEYWIADIDARLVERWRPGDQEPEMITGTFEWQPKAGIPPLLIELGEIFGKNPK